MDSARPTEPRSEPRSAAVSQGLPSYSVGSGYPILCLHGGPGATHEYLAFGLASLQRDFRLIFFDQRRPPRGRTPSMPSFEDALRDIESLCASHGLERYAVLGHSWGATLALAHALATRRTCESLFLVNAFPLGVDWPTAMFDFVERRWECSEVRLGVQKVASAARHDGDSVRQRAVRHSEQVVPLMVRTAHWELAPYLEVDAAWQQSLWRAASEYVHLRSRRLGIPIVCIQGDEDVASAAAVARSVRELGEDSAQTIASCGHLAPLEAAQELCAHVKARLRP